MRALALGRKHAEKAERLEAGGKGECPMERGNWWLILSLIPGDI